MANITTTTFNTTFNTAFNVKIIHFCKMPDGGRGNCHIIIF